MPLPKGIYSSMCVLAAAVKNHVAVVHAFPDKEELGLERMHTYSSLFAF